MHQASVRWVVTIVTVAAACTGFADDRLATAGRCASIEKDSDRLGCYDTLFRTSASSGMEEPPDNEKESLTPISARIVRIGKTSSGRQTYQLDNDQIWVKTTDRPFTIHEGDLVAIRSGRFGSFSLVTERNARTAVERLR